MMRTMDPFWTSSGASRLDKAAAPRAGGATSALALAASAAKQATLNISTELKRSGCHDGATAWQSASI